MRAIDPDRFTVADLPIPTPADGEVLIQVHAAGVNRADLLQRAGYYPPPPTASPIPGLEVAGTVVAAPPASNVSVGDDVIALLAGGGYAGYVAAPAKQCLPLPSGRTMAEGAALPEAVATSWLNLVDLAGLTAGESVYIHGGSGGVGSVAIQLAASLGAHVVTSAGSDEKCARCRGLGADVAINYRADDAAEQLREAAGKTGFDVTLDMLGAGALEASVEHAARDGRIILIGLQRGRRGEIDLGTVLAKRLRIQGSTLRSLSEARKTEIVSAMRHAVGEIHPVVSAEVPLADIETAHALMDDAATFGKVVLTL